MAPTNFLQQIRNDWASRGWASTDLDLYRMEGEDPPAGGDPNGSGSGGDMPPAGDDGKRLTQAEVDRIVQGRVADTRKAAEEQISKALGCTIEEAKRIVADSRKREDAEKTEAQKAREAADLEKTEAAKAKAEAARERHEAKVERLLVRAGIDDDKKISRMLRLIDVEVGADQPALEAAIKALKDDMPEFFGTNGNTRQGPPNGDPGGKPPRTQKTEDAYARGIERAKAAAPAAGYDLPGLAKQ